MELWQMATVIVQQDDGGPPVPPNGERSSENGLNVGVPQSQPIVPAENLIQLGAIFERQQQMETTFRENQAALASLLEQQRESREAQARAEAKVDSLLSDLETAAEGAEEAPKVVEIVPEREAPEPGPGEKVPERTPGILERVCHRINGL
jgi:hypothetical protein